MALRTKNGKILKSRIRQALSNVSWITLFVAVCAFVGSIFYYESVYSDQPENYEVVESVIPIQTAYQSRTYVYYCVLYRCRGQD